MDIPTVEHQISTLLRQRVRLYYCQAAGKASKSLGRFARFLADTGLQSLQNLSPILDAATILNFQRSRANREAV